MHTGERLVDLGRVASRGAQVRGDGGLAKALSGRGTKESGQTHWGEEKRMWQAGEWWALCWDKGPGSGSWESEAEVPGALWEVPAAMPSGPRDGCVMVSLHLREPSVSVTWR